MSYDSAFEPAKMAPHSEELEVASLGSILINPDCYPEVAGIVNPEDYFILCNGWVLEEMGWLYQNNIPIDYLTLIERLKACGRLEQIGGAARITYLASSIGTSIHAETYARTIKRLSIRRKLLDAAAEIAKAAREEEQDLPAVLLVAQKALDSVTSQAVEHDWVHIRDIASNYFDIIQARYEGKVDPFGIKTKLTDLDNMIRGFHPGRFYIVAGRPGMGKTWLLLHCALAAARQGKRVGFISLEMGKEQLINRLLSLMSGVNARSIDEGDMTDEEYKRYTKAFNEFERLDIFIDDHSFQTPRGLIMKAKRLKARFGLDMLFIDYLQLGDGDNGENGYERVSAFSRALKNLSMPGGLHIPIMAAAQLNRKVEERANKRPLLFDLSMSGQIEQDADVAIFLYRDIVYNEATQHPNRCECIVAKNRHNGGKHGTGTAFVYYDLENPHFADLHMVSLNVDL